MSNIDAPHAYYGKTETTRRAVFNFIKERGASGATLQEIERGLSMPGNTVRPRRKELEKIGAVVAAKMPNGETHLRPTRSGRMAIVWRAAYDPSFWTPEAASNSNQR
jgi:hypothetical protein